MKKILRLSLLSLIFELATLNSNAQTLQWAKSMGGTSSDYGNSIALDASGNIYTTGSFQGTADFDPGAGTFNLTSAGECDVFISKLDASGNFVYAKSMGGTDYDYGNSIALDPAGSGYVYTTGYFYGTADFDPGAGTFNLTSAGMDDIFISKLDASGNFVWAKSMGGTSDDNGYSIVIDASGNVYTTGYFEGTADFDPAGAGTFNLTSAGGYDIFVCKLSQTTGISENELLNAIKVYPNPTSGKVAVGSGSSSATLTTSINSIEIYNVLGEKIAAVGSGSGSHLSLVNPPMANAPMTIDLSFQPAGIYFIKITSNEGIIMRKIIKE